MQRVKLWGCFGSRAPEQAWEDQLLHRKLRTLYGTSEKFTIREIKMKLKKLIDDVALMNSPPRAGGQREERRAAAARRLGVSRAAAAAQCARLVAEGLVGGSQGPEGSGGGNACLVCFEMQTLRSSGCGAKGSSSGGLCALKCGHVFCPPCVETWFDGRATRKCPQCNHPGRRDAVVALRVHRDAAVIACRRGGGGSEASALQRARFRIVAMDTALIEKAQHERDEARLAHANAVSRCSRVKFERAGRQQDLELLQAKRLQAPQQRRGGAARHCVPRLLGQVQIQVPPLQVQQRAEAAPRPPTQLTSAQKRRMEANKAQALKRRIEGNKAQALERRKRSRGR